MRDIFDLERMPPELDAFLRSANPWWEGKPGRVLPTYRRWTFNKVRRQLEAGLAPAVVIRGPRQVGKTTLQEQLIVHLLEDEQVAPTRVFRVQFDELPSLRDLREPLLTFAHWFENRILGRTFNEAAHEGAPAYLFFDEVQNLPEWAPQLKSLVDHNTLRVLVTGSSALRIEAGRDSLAGRIAQLEMGTLLLREIAGLRRGHEIPAWMQENGLEPLRHADFWRGLADHAERHMEARDVAFRYFSERGGYPMVHAHPGIPWPEVADQLNETVIRRAIQHDLRLGARGQKRDEHLLEEVLRLCCRYAGQAPSLTVLSAQVQQALSANIGTQRVLSYLKFLDGALLIKLIEPLELRLKRKKGNRKICLCDHGLRASWLQEVIPLAPGQLAQQPHLADLAGHLAESAVGYYLAGFPHLGVAHFPERGVEPEVDFVLTIGEMRIPVEVKYRQRIDEVRDTIGLKTFMDRPAYNAHFGILVTMHDNVPILDPRIVSLSLPSLLLLR